MRYWNYGEIRDKVRRDLGIEQEDFVSPTEMLGYCNSAIDECESEIHSIYEDYFITNKTYSIVSGQASYDMPDDIYANKIRGLVYTDGVTVYSIKRYASIDKMFEVLENDKLNTTASEYTYHLMNPDATGLKVQLVPVPLSDLNNGMVMYYIRNANRMVDASSICDIPEFVDFVIQYMKVRCYEKEMHPNFTASIDVLNFKRKNMLNTLTNMVPDGDNKIEADLSFYWEMNNGGGL